MAEEKKSYKVIQSGALSTRYEPRFVVVDSETGEILDDAQGYGYKSMQKAHAGYSYKTRDRSKDAAKLEKHRKVYQFCKVHKDFVGNLEQDAFEIAKGSWGPDDKFDAAFVGQSFLDNGYDLKELGFTARDFLRYWQKNHRRSIVGNSAGTQVQRGDTMAILNYTTTVDAVRTAAEIEAVLVRHGAKSIMRTYDGGSISGMSFLVDTGVRQIPIKLPVRTESVLAILQKEKRENPGKRIVATKEQAEKVAWRILKDWVEAQMALIDIHMVQMEEIFLPYIELPGGNTIYEKLEQQQFLLEG